MFLRYIVPFLKTRDLCVAERTFILNKGCIRLDLMFEEFLEFFLSDYFKG